MASLSLGDETVLKAGAAVADISPPLEAGLLMSSVEGRWQPFDGIRKPLMARVLVLEQSRRNEEGRAGRVAIVSLDMLALSGRAVGGFDHFKERIVAACKGAVTADQLVLACTHTHTAPESAAITDLHHTAAFAPWVELIAQRVGQAAAAAVEQLRPCQVSYGNTAAPGLGIHRRLKTTRGIMMSHPEPPADLVISRDGPTDDSVHALAFRESTGAPIAVVVNATCHPVYEMCTPQASPDYPGELCTILESRFPGATPIYLNGAAGNINPRGVSAGPEAAQRHAEELARSVAVALQSSQQAAPIELRLVRASCQLPSRLPEGRDVGRQLSARLAVLSLGEIAIAFLPGEPFVETGLAIRQASPFQHTLICGFAEETIGYVPTDQAFAEGGYETSFGPWSMVAPTSELILRQHAIALLECAHGAAGRQKNGPFIPAPHFIAPEVAEQRNGNPPKKPVSSMEVEK